MKMLRSVLVSLCLIAVTTVTERAQDGQQQFALPDARQGEDYRVDIESVLRENYRLKLEAGSENSIILWGVVKGDLPVGFTLQTNGKIVAHRGDSRVGQYRFTIGVVDATVKDDPLLLQFSIEVKPGRLRLSKLDGPRLVPVTLTEARGNELAGNDSPKSFTPSRDPKEQPEVANPTPDPPEIQTVQNASADEIKNPFSSLNKRFIIGFEQSGGASAASQGKPFFDLFINTPLTKSDSPEPARASVWGDVRLTSTPEQINAFANVTNNAIGVLTGGEVNRLTSGFDFVVGPEIRLKKFRNTELSVIAGFGAISPLTPKESVQIFQVPESTSSQAEAFFKEFPGAKDKKYIAFISPDRDRFLRQYFGGFRFKTYTYEETDAKDKRGNTVKVNAIQNVFPAMFDITFGQSEAVTGGKLTKFVLGLDGFYPLPFPDKYRFLYLFGTAKFKVGGPRTIATPFLLDTAASSIGVTDPAVFIAEPRSSNRDFYRIGFGVDLFELFRKKKPEPPAEAPEAKDK